MIFSYNESGCENKIWYRIHVRFLYFNEQVGIVSPKIVNSLGEVQDSFRKFLTPSNFILRQLRRIFIEGMR